MYNGTQESTKANDYQLVQSDICEQKSRKVRCQPRNMTNFNQKLKILKILNFRYDTET